MQVFIKRLSAAQFCLGVSAFLTLAPAGASAAVRNETLTLRSCDNGLLTNCADTAHMSTTLAGANSRFIGSPVVGRSVATFTTAFDAWDAANGDKWKLVNGGALPLKINTTVGLSAGNDGAGLSPVIFTLSGGSPSLLSQLEWTQALVANYTPLEGSLTAPIETLDTFSLSQDAAGDNPGFPGTCVSAGRGASPSGGAFCGPVYPFQYGSTLSNDALDGVPLGVDPFYDAPEGAWPNASFDAITLLSSVNPSTDTLTVYDGVAYGFSLRASAGGRALGLSRAADPIPEPSTWALALCGFAAVGFARCAARRSSAA